MNERLIPFASFVLAAAGESAGSAVGGYEYVPKAMLLTHISNGLAITGTPSAATVDVQDDGVDIETARSVAAAALTTLTTPVRIAAGSKMSIDLNFTGGTSPKGAGKITLWGYVAE
jgi:hypothetical protein